MTSDVYAFQLKLDYEIIFIQVIILSLFIITIYSKLRKIPWFLGYKVEIKYKLFSLKIFISSF